MPIDLFTMVATGVQLFISAVVGAVVLHRGPTHFSPDGEHCCVRNSDNTHRICVTFSECMTILSMSMATNPPPTAPCPTLSPLSNGMISYNAATNIATYTCNTGYTVTGYTVTGTISSITCNEDTMQWSSTERLTCECKRSIFNFLLAYSHLC